MRIERVDDKTVKCFLSNEELDEYNIDYKDFDGESKLLTKVIESRGCWKSGTRSI